MNEWIRRMNERKDENKDEWMNDMTTKKDEQMKGPKSLFATYRWMKGWTDECIPEYWLVEWSDR